jgi:hypothetical protein
MGFNLDFSSWDAANKALQEGRTSSEKIKSQTKVSQKSGLMAGIGTVVGAIFGAPATGRAIGEAVGGGGNTSDTETDTDLFDQITDWYKKKKLPKWQQDMSDAERSTIATDPMQVASAMNAIGGGDVIDTMTAASKMYGGLV